MMLGGSLCPIVFGTDCIDGIQHRVPTATDASDQNQQTCNSAHLGDGAPSADARHAPWSTQSTLSGVAVIHLLCLNPPLAPCQVPEVWEGGWNPPAPSQNVVVDYSTKH